MVVMVPKELRRRIQAVAEENGRTLHHEVRLALRGHLDREGERQERREG